METMTTAKKSAAKSTATVSACARCSGTGRYLHFGTCFACNGAGQVRVYTKLVAVEKLPRTTTILRLKNVLERLASWQMATDSFETADLEAFGTLLAHADQDVADRASAAVARIAPVASHDATIILKSWTAERAKLATGTTPVVTAVRKVG